MYDFKGKWEVMSKTGLNSGVIVGIVDGPFPAGHDHWDTKEGFVVGVDTVIKSINSNGIFRKKYTIPFSALKKIDDKKNDQELGSWNVIENLLGWNPTKEGVRV